MKDGLDELPEFRSQTTHEVLDGLHCSFYLSVLVLLGAIGTGEFFQEKWQALPHELLDDCLVSLYNRVIFEDLERRYHRIHAILPSTSLPLLCFHSFPKKDKSGNEMTSYGVNTAAYDMNDSTGNVLPMRVKLYHCYKRVDIRDHQLCIVLTSLAKSAISLFSKQIIVETNRVVIEQLLCHCCILDLVAHQRAEQLEKCSFDQDWSLEMRMLDEFYVGVDQHVDVLVYEVQVFQGETQRKEEDFKISPEGVAALLQLSDLVACLVHVLLVSEDFGQDAEQFFCFFSTFVDLLSLAVFFDNSMLRLRIEVIDQVVGVSTLTAQCSVDILQQILCLISNANPCLSKIDLSVQLLQVSLPKFAVILEDPFVILGKPCYLIDKAQALGAKVNKVFNCAFAEAEDKVDVGLRIGIFKFGDEFFNKWEQIYYIIPQVPDYWGVVRTTLGQSDDPIQTIQRALRSIEVIEQREELRHHGVPWQAVENGRRIVEGDPCGEAVDQGLVIDVFILPESISYFIQQGQDRSLSLQDLLLHVFPREVIQDQLIVVQLHRNLRQDLEVAIVKMIIFPFIEGLEELIDSDWLERGEVDEEIGEGLADLSLDCFHAD